MPDNAKDRKALRELAQEPFEERAVYFRKPFMVLWAAVQEASAELAEDYGMSPEAAQIWVAEQLREVADSLVDRLAEKAVARGASKSNVARAAGSAPANASRRFPRLAPGADVSRRLLIDEVLDDLSS